MTSETPRVDAELAKAKVKLGVDGGYIYTEPWSGLVSGDFARTMERELNEARGNLEQCRVQLAACGVIAGCNTRTTLAEQLPTPDSYGYSASLLDVARAVTREMNERERAEASEHNFAIEHDALVKAESALAECMAHADCMADSYYQADSHVVTNYRTWRAEQ